MNWLKCQQVALSVGLGLACLGSGTFMAAQAEAATLFTANLSGSQEAPPNASTATGFGSVLLNDAEDMIAVNLTFSGLTTPATLAHIHGPALPGINAGVLFNFTSALPPGATSGTIPEQVFTITPIQVDYLKQGLLYFNVHTSTFPGGEIRGQIAAVPESQPLSILGLAVALGGGLLLRRQAG